MTLIELMVVVVIIGILAVMTVPLFSKQLSRAQSSEARAVVRAIASAQEAYRAENRVFLNIGETFYPFAGAPGTRKTRFFGMDTHPDSAAWLELAPEVDMTVRCIYRTRAGLPGEAVPDVFDVGDPGWPAAPPEPWYVVEARCNNRRTASSATVFYISSFNNRIVETQPGG